MMLFTNLIILLISMRLARTELFSAQVDFGMMFETEKRLYDTLMRYSIGPSEHSPKLNEIALAMKLHYESVPVEQVNKSMSNPLITFLLVKRFKFNWFKELEDSQELHPNVLATLRNEVSLFEKYLPTQTDLEGCIDAIVRLQETYKLDTRKMVDGTVFPGHQSWPLTAEECFVIGQNFHFQYKYHYSRLWMSEALRLLNEARFDLKSILTSKVETQLDRVTLLDYLGFALYKDNDIRQAAEVTRQLLEIDPTYQRAIDNLAYYETHLDSTENEPKKKLSSYEEQIFLYEALCRDEDVMPYPHKHQLYCHYLVPHPHYIIGPVKLEIAHFDPKVVVYHDILHDSEINSIIKVSTPMLQRATGQNLITGQIEVIKSRVSKSAWLADDLNEVTKITNKRISAITGLNIETAELLQVVNYGLGGHYVPHYDFRRKIDKDTHSVEIGNRIATLIYYMSDVEAGGYTVFTELGLRVKPVKGSAAFWWNLLPSGEGDLATMHAACPVLLGTKWVMNKWFHERGQEFHRPCMLEEDGLDYNSTYRMVRSPEMWTRFG